MVEDSFAEHEQSMQQRTRDWQLRLMVALIVGVVGVGLALYATLALWRADGLDLSRALAGPLLYGLIAAIVLADLYLAQKEAVIQGLEQEAVKQKIEAELNRELALLDPVTEVYNRRYLRVLLKKELSRVQRYQTALSMMMVDITGFRRVNESLGHTGGDVVLRQIAYILRNQTRNSDIIVRFGGDEFLVVLPDTEDEGAYILVDRLKQGLADWSSRSGMTEFELRFAIGVARYAPERRLDEILELAEHRMVRDRQQKEDSGRPAPARAEGSSS